MNTIERDLLLIMREFPRDTDTIARWGDLSPEMAERILSDFLMRGWVEKLEIGAYDWWRLTADGMIQQNQSLARAKTSPSCT